MSMRVICALLIALIGCGRELDVESWAAPRVPADLADDGGDGASSFLLQPQGRQLLGGRLEDPPYSPAGGPRFHVSTSATYHDPVSGPRAITLSVVNAAALAAEGHVGADPYFDRVVLTGGGRDIALGIVGGDANAAHYTLTAVADGADLCDGLDAIPVAGLFRADGLHVPAPARITFGCGDGVVRKCHEWGYDPGTQVDAHQACTRMARGDFLANGVPHTREGTVIMIGDAVPGGSALPTSFRYRAPIAWPPDPTMFYYEAAWRPGAQTAICLSKKRWSELPLGNLLGLPDPRLDAAGRTCEDYDVADLVADGALLFSASRVNDAPLNHWHAVTGTPDHVTTILGYYARTAGQTVQPFGVTRAYVFDGVDGYLLRVVPTSITDIAHDLRVVRLVRNVTTDRFVLVADDDLAFATPIFERLAPEGWVFTAQRNGTVAFRLWQGPSGDYVSTIDARVPGGYTWVSNIGYVAAPEMP